MPADTNQQIQSVCLFYFQYGYHHQNIWNGCDQAGEFMTFPRLEGNSFKPSRLGECITSTLQPYSKSFLLVLVLGKRLIPHAVYFAIEQAFESVNQYWVHVSPFWAHYRSPEDQRKLIKNLIFPKQQLTMRFHLQVSQGTAIGKRPYEIPEAYAQNRSRGYRTSIVAVVFAVRDSLTLIEN